MPARKPLPASICNWCGARVRKRPGCPRGPQCAREEAEHARLEKRIKNLEKKKEKAP